MAKRTSVLPKAPLGRILLNAGAKRVSQESVDAFADVLEEILEDIATQASKIARHAGRKTVQESDIRLAAKQ
ncbi:histone family protein [Candidatus Woesearchaeota archaeon]|nr:histone family protein [Candidatus Woesearchaeota archaeon]